MNRRHFLRLSGAGLAGFVLPLGRAPLAAEAPGGKKPLDVTTALRRRGTGSRPAPAYLRENNYAQHVNRTGAGREYDLGGIDYAPVQWFKATEICPVAAGAITAHRDDVKYGGMVLTVAHGLGWRTEYAHLDARYKAYPERVTRREVIAIMGRAGQGATRSGVMETHLHLTLYGPIYSPLFAGIAIQERPKSRLRWRYVLDPEEFSLDGQHARLPYNREEDTQRDDSFLAKHRAAVTFCTTLLERINDLDSQMAAKREPWELATGLDAHVDERLWFVWQRLQTGPHPFSEEEVTEYRATLMDFMTTVPWFTAPIVEPERRGEYRCDRATPLKVYGQ